MIVSTRYDGVNCCLVDEESGEVARRGIVVSGRGDEYRLTGGRAPHKASSTGKVWVEDYYDSTRRRRDFYPGVFGLMWAPVVSEAEG